MRLSEPIRSRDVSEIQDALKQLHWQVYESETSMPEDLCYLSGKYLEDYLHDVEICQAFARRSREKMAEIILERTGMAGREAFHTIHNYIDTDEMILRKGAIAAHSGEKVLIPINMEMEVCLLLEKEIRSGIILHLTEQDDLCPEQRRKQILAWMNTERQ